MFITSKGQKTTSTAKQGGIDELGYVLKMKHNSKTLRVSAATSYTVCLLRQNDGDSIAFYEEMRGRQLYKE